MEIDSTAWLVASVACWNKYLSFPFPFPRTFRVKRCVWHWERALKCVGKESQLARMVFLSLLEPPKSGCDGGQTTSWKLGRRESATLASDRPARRASSEPVHTLKSWLLRSMQVCWHFVKVTSILTISATHTLWHLCIPDSFLCSIYVYTRNVAKFFFLYKNCCKVLNGSRLRSNIECPSLDPILRC